MDINELTVSQVNELAEIFGWDIPGKKVSLFDRYIGKYVICRSRNEGINAGNVIAADETGVVLQDARRLYYHIPLDTNISWYEGVALSGVGRESKVGSAVEKLIVEDYSLTVCTKQAEQSIRSAKDHEQS